jgi:hypothetical protein
MSFSKAPPSNPNETAIVKNNPKKAIGPQLNGFIASMKLGKFCELLDSIEEEFAFGNRTPELLKDRDDLNKIISHLSKVLKLNFRIVIAVKNL